MGFKNGKQEITICWDCARSCTGGCSWAERFEPVEGWTAEPETIYNGGSSYLVKKCPMFKRENREERQLDDDGVIALLERLMEITREDYCKGTEVTQQEIERFIRGKGASRLHRIEDPDSVIEELKRARSEYQKKRYQKSMVKG